MIDKNGIKVNKTDISLNPKSAEFIIKGCFNLGIKFELRTDSELIALEFMELIKSKPGLLNVSRRIEYIDYKTLEIYSPLLKSIKDKKNEKL